MKNKIIIDWNKEWLTWKPKVLLNDVNEFNTLLVNIFALIKSSFRVLLIGTVPNGQFILVIPISNGLLDDETGIIISFKEELGSICGVISLTIFRAKILKMNIGNTLVLLQLYCKIRKTKTRVIILLRISTSLCSTVIS